MAIHIRKKDKLIPSRSGVRRALTLQRREGGGPWVDVKAPDGTNDFQSEEARTSAVEAMLAEGAKLRDR